MRLAELEIELGGAGESEIFFNRKSTGTAEDGRLAAQVEAPRGDNLVLANAVNLAGHVSIGDWAILGGMTPVHQFVRIGRGAIIGAVTMVTNDVIPYGLVQAPRGELDGLNLVGLKRRGVSRADITALRAAFQMLAQGEGTFHDRAERLQHETSSDYVREIVDFVLSDSDRHFLTPR